MQINRLGSSDDKGENGAVTYFDFENFKTIPLQFKLLLRAVTAINQQLFCVEIAISREQQLYESLQSYAIVRF